MKNPDKRFSCFNLLIAAVILGVIIGCICSYCGIDSDKLAKSLRSVDESRYDAQIAAAAAKYNLPMELVRAVVWKESRFVADKVGSKGEIGLMQVLPSGAAAEWARINKKKAPSAFELYDVDTNLDIGCWYLARALKKWQAYRHGTELALAEYNAGGRNARKWKPPTFDGDVVSRITFPITKKYVSEIMSYYRRELNKKALR